MENKCFRCGLVNWPEAVECGRCRAALGASDAGFETAKRHEPAVVKDGSGSVKKVLVVLVLVGLGFGGYMYFGSSDSGNAAKTGAANQPVNAAKSLSPEEFLEAKKREAEQTAAAKAANPSVEERMAKEFPKVDPKAFATPSLSGKNFKMDPKMVQESQKRFDQNGVHFGPGAMPPGSFERSHPRSQ